MGYQIHYGATMVKEHIYDRKQLRFTRKNIKRLIIGIAVLMGIIFCCQDKVQDFLLPGNSQVTRTAISGLVSDLKHGKSLSDSVEAFCVEIVSGAKLPQ